MTSAYVGAYVVTTKEIKNTTQEVLNRGFAQNPSIEEASIILVQVKGTAYFFRRASKYTEAEQTAIIRSTFNSDSKLFEYNGRFFYYDYVQNDNGTLYAIRDVTTFIEAYKTLFLAMLGALVLCGLLIGFMAWQLSKQTFKPLDTMLVKQRELTANISHDLKTPLTVINAELALVKSDIHDVKPELDSNMDRIERQVESMDKLIIELLELAKLEANVGLNISNVNVSDVIENVALTMEAICFEKQIELNYNVGSDLIMACDKSKFEKLILIMVDNAVKYTPQNGKIDITLARRKNIAHVEIQNTGEGVSKDKLSKIFDRFYRSDESRTDSGKSFGLGLAIAKSLVEAMRGDICCESVEGEYARFIIDLPITLVSKPKNAK